MTKNAFQSLKISFAHFWQGECLTFLICQGITQKNSEIGLSQIF